MSFDINALLDLWSGPVVAGPDAEAAFRRLYTDPVVVNGAELSVPALVERAARLQDTFETVERKILDVAEVGNKVAVAFRLSGRQIGPMTTAAGTAPDELGALHAVGAVRLAGDPRG